MFFANTACILAVTQGPVSFILRFNCYILTFILLIDKFYGNICIFIAYEGFAVYYTGCA